MKGDFNGSGAVDTADYIVWRRNLGQTVLPASPGDGNEDGWIDQNDYAIWRANFGRTSNPAPARTDAAVGYWDVPGLRVVDFVTYGPQTNDDSQGRLPNGTGPLTFFATPTPGAANQAGGSAAAAAIAEAVGHDDDLLLLALENSARRPDTHSSDSMVSDDSAAEHAVDAALADLSTDLLGME
jgi:hypothetical protein